jgi:hypothetical protein
MGTSGRYRHNCWAHSVASVERAWKSTTLRCCFSPRTNRLDDPLSDIRYFALGDAHEMTPLGFKGLVLIGLNSDTHNEIVEVFISATS